MITLTIRILETEDSVDMHQASYGPDQTDTETRLAFKLHDHLAVFFKDMLLENKCGKLVEGNNDSVKKMIQNEGSPLGFIDDKDRK